MKITPQRPVILILSDQDFLHAGNQLLFQAVRGYIRGGFDVRFISDEKIDRNVASSEELFGDRSVHCRITRFKPVLSGVVHWMRSSAIFAKNKPSNKGNLRYPASDEILPFAKSLRHAPRLTQIRNKLLNWKMQKVALGLAKYENIVLVCGYEVGAAKAAARVANKLKVPFFTRYQGTFLYPTLAAGEDPKQEFPVHYEGTKLKADLIVMENDGTRGKEVLEMLGHSPEKIKFWVDGINKNISNGSLNKQKVYANHNIALNKEDKVILTLSKMNRWKRHDRILRAMPQILESCPNARLVFGHRGDMRVTLENMAKELGVSHRVHFTGAVPHVEVGKLLNTCDIYVNVNEHSNLSNPVLEAMECGRPVVTLNDGSLNGIISNGQNGMLCPLESIKTTLPKLIVQLFLDDDLWTRISKNARNYAVEHLYDWERRMEWEVEELNKLMND
jgi:glycosyltransferase involved in cell wall biosynthesis